MVTAIAAAEEIEISEEEMVEALAHSAEHERTTPEKLLERLRENGRDAMIREDLMAQKAIELVSDSAKPIPQEADAEPARPKAAEPGGDPRPRGSPSARRNRPGKLWTPGDE